MADSEGACGLCESEAGVSIEPQDRPRLRKLADRVRACCLNSLQLMDRAPDAWPAFEHAWLTLKEIQHVTGGSEAGISARLRELRRTSASTNRIYAKISECPDPYLVERRRRGDSGLFEYRVSLPEPSKQREMW